MSFCFPRARAVAAVLLCLGALLLVVAAGSAHAAIDVPSIGDCNFAEQLLVMDGGFLDDGSEDFDDEMIVAGRESLYPGWCNRERD